MILKSLSIINYKNIIQAELDFSRKINCFVGSNGEGKTNILDAIYYLSFCKSSISQTDLQVIRHESDFMMLQGKYEGEDGSEELIDCSVQRRGRKRFKRGKKDYPRLIQHIGLIPLVLISPTDDALIGGGSEERRRFMDVVISQTDPLYMDHLLRYNRALQQRNALLKSEEEPDSQMMDLYEGIMASEGECIYLTRKAFIDRLTPVFSHYYHFLSDGKEEVSLHYSSHGERGPLLPSLHEDRNKSHIVGYSLHGIHRDELEMFLGGYPIKREGSQGQNKTFLIAMKLAQFDFLSQEVTHTTPILLLDDIFDKLDASRVESIIQLIYGKDFGQIFITDTNRAHLDHILQKAHGEYRLFHVERGEVKL